MKLWITLDFRLDLGQNAGTFALKKPKLDKRELWEKIVNDLRATVARAKILTWFKATAVIGKSEDSITIGVPTAMAELQLSQKFNTEITNSAQKIDPKIKTVAYRVDPSLEFKGDARAIDFDFLKGEDGLKKRKMPKQAEVKIGDFRSVQIDKRYTLENFVVGPDNRLAHAAASAVANEPGKNYNPLFIYGGVGMGKTHLLQGIGNAIERRNNNLVVIYQTSEMFTNELIKTIREHKADHFKDKYRKADVLLIDDVQFFVKKERTQEEFFHTFNALYMAGKQIVLTADRPPKELAGLDDRLISRFEQGMVVDVQFPDFETRLAILHEKCHERGMIIPPEVLEFIAENVSESVRELEGVLVQAIAESELEKSTPTIRSVMKHLKKTNRKKPIIGIEDDVNFEPVKNLDDLVKRVAEFFEVSVEDIKSPSRKAKIANPRQMAIYLAREKMGYTLEEIGEYFGGRDHTTILHSVRKVEKQKENDKRYLRNFNALKKEIRL